MEHIESLPLKYRPMTFEDLVGQEVISKYLSKLIQRGQNAKNIILAGSYGTGKTSSGRIYARALNCLTPTVEGSPCNYCKNCTAHIDKVYTDYKELDGATQGRAENIRTLVELAYTPPMFGRYRILLVDECHALSKAAWDSLLKVVEEPPPYLCFIFATTELDKMRPAIISRCQAFEVTLLDHATSVSHLKKICTLENIPHDDDALSLISYVSKGHPRDLLKNLEQCSFYGELNLDNASAILNLGYIKNLREFLRAWQADDLAKMRLEILNWTSSPQEIIWVLQEFFIYVTHMTLKISGAKINPLFTTIPRPEMSAFYSWMEKNVAADIAGGVAEALSNCVEILQRSPATNVLSLEILISSLYQYAYDAKFRIKKFGKHSNVAQTKTEATEGPVQKTRQRRVIEGSAPPIAGVVPSRINPMNPNHNANQSAQTQQQNPQPVQQENHVMPQTPSSVSFDDDEVVVNLQTDKVYPHTLQAQGFTTVMEASEAREI